MEEQAVPVAFVCMGGNLGPVQETFQKALILLQKEGAFSETPLKSRIYESPYWSEDPNDDPQPPYLDQVIGFHPLKDPEETLRILLRVEHQLGRVREKRFVARTIDLDLLAYADCVCSTPDLILPHPRLHLRRFVLQPWSEIAPGFILPGFNRTVLELLRDCPDQGELREVF